MSKYDTLEQIILATAEMVRPPERLTVAESAEKYVYVNYPGAYVGYYNNASTPYLKEPMETLTSRDFTSCVFVGPARAGKTQMFLNWAGYSAVCDPGDMMLVQPSKDSARDFSMRDLDRMIRYSPEVRSRMIQKLSADNTFDKQFSSGMILKLSWPSINELSGKTLGRGWLADYDRMPSSVDGEGSAFDLLKRRTQTFKRNGMTVVESSPGFPVTNPKWVPSTPHEAPPAEGILALYNRGDRRRWYWPCPGCNTPFEPDFSLLLYPDTKDYGDAAAQAYMGCPHCGQVIHHNRDEKNGTPGKNDLNMKGRWLKDRQWWDVEKNTVGGGVRSDDTASFWLKGVAAAFNTWEKLVLEYLKANDEYERTGNEEALKVTINTGQGLPYIPKNQAAGRLPEELKSRARNYGERVVPRGVRFLLACVDVQKNRFVVQVHGVGVGRDIWPIDRFEIRKSKRKDEDGDVQPLDPGAYLEDWKLLVERVMTKTYPLQDDSGRHMRVKLTACDSGGADGVTAKAYDFYRYLRDTDDEGVDPNLFRRFKLVKGDPRKGAPRVMLTYPDSQRKDRHADARGEIPVWLLHSDTLKDQLNAMLDRSDPNGGRVNFPNWLSDDWYTELTVETRNEKGKWENPKKLRNESWDLLTYCLALQLMPEINIENLDWEDPPSWASDWDDNDLVFDPNSTNSVTVTREVEYGDLGQLASALA